MPVWPLVMLMLTTLRDNPRARRGAGNAGLLLVALGLMTFAATPAVVKAVITAPLKITRGLVVGIARAYLSAYTTGAGVARGFIASAIRSLVHQVLPGTIPLSTWLDSYDSQGIIRRQLAAGSIQEWGGREPGDDPLGILDTPAQ